MFRAARAAIRLVHPAPAFAVTALSGALALILAREAGPVDQAAVALTTAAVGGSQVFTGATNDLADQARDASLRADKPLPNQELSASAALWIAAAGLALQVAASGRLGTTTLVLGLVATGSALTYNLWLSRTPLSFVPYLVSFGVLPLWVASGVHVPLERVAPAVVLVPPFAVSAHLANTIKDFDVDAAVGSRCLTQMLGRRTAHRVAVGLAVGVGVVAGIWLFAGGRPNPVSVVLGVLGLAATLLGARDQDRLWQGLLAAAVLWAVAWALGSG